FDDHLFDDDTLTDRELYLAGMAGTDGMRMLSRLDASDQRKVQVSYLVQYGAEFFRELRDIGYTRVKSSHFDLDDAPNSAAGYMCNAAVSLGVLALEEERSAHRSSLYRKEEPEALSDYAAFFDRLQPSE
ncbi:MAG: hypothetical protein SVU88_00565, partial [Candidatus Nanohaloarchaea archaeon]|nr:hypothetical protein [Candidatus Nanohaloarchaea archaeon]